MTVDPIGFLPALAEPSIDGGIAAPQSDFASWMRNELAAANSKLLGTEQQLQQLAAGETTNLHQVMIGLEDARLSFQLLVQIRNHLLEGYQDILRMQV